jgi:hypothetical protein
MLGITRRPAWCVRLAVRAALVVVACGPALWAGSASGAERRIALVVGNERYSDARLRNPSADATAMGELLGDLGFRVTVRKNLTKAELRKAVDSFVRRLRSGDMALFFYAGHGFEIGGENYLLGTDFDFDVRNDADAADDAYRVQTLLKRLNERRRGVSIAVLDACRNNPYQRQRGPGRGFVAVRKEGLPEGTYVALSSSPGQGADDGPRGGHSPYVEALLQHMRKPGVELDHVFRFVVADVLSTTAKRQRPWSRHSMQGIVYLAGKAPPAPPQCPPGSVFRLREGCVPIAVERPMSAFTKRKILGSLLGWGATGATVAAALGLGASGNGWPGLAVGVGGGGASTFAWIFLPEEISGGSAQVMGAFGAWSACLGASFGALALDDDVGFPSAVGIASGLVGGAGLLAAQIIIIAADEPNAARATASLPVLLVNPAGVSLGGSF